MSEMSGVVILAGPGESTNIVYHHLSRSVGIDRVILESPVPRREFLARRVRRLGAATVAGQLAFKLAVVAPLERASAARKRQIKEQYRLIDEPIPADRVTHVSSANSARTIKLLHVLAPRVVVVNGTRILSKALLGAAPATFINMHAGVTPLYRGVHGGYWALANGDAEHCGVTVHLVDTGIDTGKIVEQASIAPGPSDNFVTYSLLQVAAGLPLLERAVSEALAGRLQLRDAPPGPSKLWTHPTLRQYMEAWVRRSVR